MTFYIKKKHLLVYIISFSIITNSCKKDDAAVYEPAAPVVTVLKGGSTQNRAVRTEAVDQNSDAVEGATITFTHVTTGIVYSGTTDELGILLQSLPEGTYDVLAEKEGFQNWQQQVEINADLTLQVQFSP